MEKSNFAAATPYSVSQGLLALGLEDRALLQLAQALKDQSYRFITVSPASHERVNRRAGNAWARNIVDVFGWSRPFKENLLPPTLFALMRAAAILRPSGEGWRSNVRFSTLPNRPSDRSVAEITDGGNDELLVHSAYPTLDTDAVFLGPDTYRFNAAIHNFLGSEPRSIRAALDLGCGTAAGAIAIARERPDATVIASDINNEALRLARVNAVLANTAGITVKHSNLFKSLTGDFDFIVANPPFLLDPEERSYRHGGGEWGEALSLAMVQAALPRLLPGGTLLMYTGVAIIDGIDPLLTQLQKILPLLQVRWSYREVDTDIFGEELEAGVYKGADRIAAVVLTATSMGPVLPAC